MKNILGEDFDNEIKTQIDVRQESLGKYSNILSKDLTYYLSKTPWLKLSSAVNIIIGSKNYNILKEALGGDESYLVDFKLAKNCILHGGASSMDSPTPQSGLRQPNSPLLSGAYGWGGGERGFVPQPGIVGADVTYYNNGALSKATVSIKCFSREQFAIIDALYMRPGYGVLLEFGWSMYLDENKNIQKFDTFDSEPLKRFFRGPLKDNLEMYRLIKEERLEYKGNYDGIYGKISKFDWKFNNDGSYDITIQITGYGDMIESLKVASPYITIPEVESKDKDFFDYLKSFSEDEDSPLSKISLLHKDLYDLKTKGNSIDHSPSKNIDVYDNKTIRINSKTSGKSHEYNSYISFVDLLALIKKDILLKLDNDNSLIDFDVLQRDENDPDKAKNFFVFTKNSFSSNPKNILVPFNTTSLEENNNKRITDIEGDLKFLNEESPLKKVNIEDDIRGDLRYIYLSIDEIFKIVTSSFREKGVDVFDLLNSILKLINNSLGGINQLTPILDNSEGLIRIIDYSPLMLLSTEKDNKNKIATFNIFGVDESQGSFVRNIDLSSEISDDFSTMISIGAAANKVQIDANSTSFSNYNKGLIDRIVPDLLQPGQESSEEPTLEEKIKEYISNRKKDFEDSFKKIYVDLQFDDENINSLVTFNNGFQQLLIQKESRSKKTSSFFLPFNLQLTMDGLGGMKLYQRFKVNENQKVLPPMYDGQNIDLIIKGINHSITPAGWTTTLDSLSVPKSTAK